MIFKLPHTFDPLVYPDLFRSSGTTMTCSAVPLWQVLSSVRGCLAIAEARKEDTNAYTSVAVVMETLDDSLYGT